MGVSVVTISIEEFERLVETKKQIIIIKKLLRNQQKKKEEIKETMAEDMLAYDAIATLNAFTIGAIKGCINENRTTSAGVGRLCNIVL